MQCATSLAKTIWMLRIGRALSKYHRVQILAKGVGGFEAGGKKLLLGINVYLSVLIRSQ